MKHVTGKVDISELEIEAIDDAIKCLKDQAYKAATEVLEYVFADDETYIYFPVEWSGIDASHPKSTDGLGGPGIKDPLTMYLRVGLDSGEEEKPSYEFNLREVLRDSLADCKNDGSFSGGLERLSIALVELAADINVATCAWKRRRDSK